MPLTLASISVVNARLAVGGVGIGFIRRFNLRRTPSKFTRPHRVTSVGADMIDVKDATRSHAGDVPGLSLGQLDRTGQECNQSPGACCCAYLLFPRRATETAGRIHRLSRYCARRAGRIEMGRPKTLGSAGAPCGRHHLLVSLIGGLLVLVVNERHAAGRRVLLGVEDQVGRPQAVVPDRSYRRPFLAEVVVPAGAVGGAWDAAGSPKPGCLCAALDQAVVAAGHRCTGPGQPTARCRRPFPLPPAYERSGPPRASSGEGGRQQVGLNITTWATNQ